MRATSVIVAGHVSMRVSRVCLLQQAKCVHNDLIEQSEVKEKRGSKVLSVLYEQIKRVFHESNEGNKCNCCGPSFNESIKGVFVTTGQVCSQ